MRGKEEKMENMFHEPQNPWFSCVSDHLGHPLVSDPGLKLGPRICVCNLFPRDAMLLVRNDISEDHRSKAVSSPQLDSRPT